MEMEYIYEMTSNQTKAVSWGFKLISIMTKYIIMNRNFIDNDTDIIIIFIGREFGVVT